MTFWIAPKSKNRWIYYAYEDYVLTTGIKAINLITVYVALLAIIK